MKTYRRPETKKQYRISRAARLRRESARTLETAHEMASDIATVEPLLSSRHPEARDRRYRRRLYGTLTRAALQDAAAHRLDLRKDFSLYGINGTDPDALPKLRIVLEQLSLARHTMKAANVYVRNNDRYGLRKLLFSESEIDRLLQADFTGHRGFSPALMNNIKADIEQTSRRIHELENARYRSLSPRIQPATIQAHAPVAIVAA